MQPPQRPQEQGKASIAHRHIYSRLIEIDENSEIVGDLAESWEQVSDTEWKFKIHEGVKFHDGTDCTASDVKFSLERAKEMPRVKQYVEQIDSITVEDDHNLTLHLAEPYAPLLAALSHTGTSIVPEAAVTAQGDAFWENPIGTGPMQFVEWVPNDHYSLKRFDDYFKGPGKTTSLTLRIMPEGGARTIALETGEIDMSISVDATDVQNVKANKELMALEKTAVSVEYLDMNCEKEPFNDLKVRQAINYALNQQYPGIQRGDHRLFPGSGKGQGPDGRGRISGRQHFPAVPYKELRSHRKPCVLQQSGGGYADRAGPEGVRQRQAYGALQGDPAEDQRRRSMGVPVLWNHLYGHPGRLKGLCAPSIVCKPLRKSVLRKIKTANQ